MSRPRFAVLAVVIATLAAACAAYGQTPDPAADPWKSWGPPATALAGVILSGLVAWLTARRTRLGSYHLALLNKRLEAYPALQEATMGIALYFPDSDVAPADCRAAGNKLRQAYFRGAGILMSEKTRDRYFTLAAALTRAANAERLNVPTVEMYAGLIDDSRIDKYRDALRLDSVVSLQVVADWRFGSDTAAHGTILNDGKVAQARLDVVAELFRDFVLLQKVSSQLRTAMADDIGGRSGPPV